MIFDGLNYSNMKYNTLNITVPFDKREGYNKKILSLVQTGNTQGITEEEIFNVYTGKARLHGLERNAFDNYYQFSEAKKDFEQGQFFTPHALCSLIVRALQPEQDFKIGDLTCGIGNFFNYLPKEANIYGNELDEGAYAICNYLYPQANINKGDFIYYAPEEKLDLIIGNPPFNLKTSLGVSQYAYIQRAASMLKYGGLLAIIVPDRFLTDEFQDSRKIEWINDNFDFILQASLPKETFEAEIATKWLVLQRIKIPDNRKPYCVSSFVDFEPDQIYQRFIQPLYDQNRANAAKYHLLTVQEAVTSSELKYKIRKHLWHIKSNPILRDKYYGKAFTKLDQLKTQRKPDNITDKEWERIRLTPEKVNNWMKAILRDQNLPPARKELKIVKTNYGLKRKAYHKSLSGKAWEESVHNLLANGERFQPFTKLYARKAAALNRQNLNFSEMSRDGEIDQFLNEFTLTPVCEKGSLFPVTDAPTIRLNDMQKHDLGLLFQKRYALLSWEQGGGKSVAGMAWLKFHEAQVKNIFILAPALAINTTWTERLAIYGFDFINVESIGCIAKIKPGQVILISYDRLVSLQRFVKKFVRFTSYKIGLLVDESDDLTNAHSQRSYAALNCFRKAKYKLLTTGTTTRNNINELFTQMELLYNNSTAFTCWANTIYHTEKNGDIQAVQNDQVGFPFPAYRGSALFKACFCPQKSTVFGIRKDTQDIYNSELLKELVSKTIITRKFEEIVGEKKYSIHTHSIVQNVAEQELYNTLLKDFLKVVYQFYNSTGNTRKEAALRLIRQIKALIKATSVPHLLPGYSGNDTPGKYLKVKELAELWPGELVAIGTIFKSAASDYFAYLSAAFPTRKLFYIDGEAPVPKRKQILEQFRVSKTGILVCTQQSLKSSVNIPYCNKCIIESLQWNIPKISQFYFRFIRFDSPRHTQVHFINYENTIELNLLALLMAKEKLNDFVKTTNESTTAAIYEEFGINLNILDMLIEKSYDNEGNLVLNWGKQKLR